MLGSVGWIRGDFDGGGGIVMGEVYSVVIVVVVIIAMYTRRRASGNDESLGHSCFLRLAKNTGCSVGRGAHFFGVERVVRCKKGLSFKVKFGPC